MKYIFILFLLTGSINAQAFKVGETQRSYSNVNSIWIGVNTSKIEIHGDSLSAIKLLIKELDRRSEELEQKTICIYRSAEWSNTVPDYFKQSSSWKLYQKELHNQGYKTTIKRTPKKPIKKKVNHANKNYKESHC